MGSNSGKYLHRGIDSLGRNYSRLRNRKTNEDMQTRIAQVTAARDLSADPVLLSAIEADPTPPGSFSDIKTPGLVGSGQQYDRAVWKNVDFSGGEFVDTLLGGATIDQSTLDAVNFDESWMADSEWQGSSARGATANKANLAYARFDDCDLTGMTGKGSVFTGAAFSNGSSLADSKFEGAVFSNARFDAESDMDNADMSGCTMQEVGLPGLTGTNLSGADLKRAYSIGRTHSQADMSEADISRTNWAGSNMAGCDFSRSRSNIGSPASFVNSDISGTSFVGAELQDVDFEATKITGSTFVGADLTGANFAGAELNNVDFTNAKIGGANFTGATVNGRPYVDASSLTATNVTA